MTTTQVDHLLTKTVKLMLMAMLLIVPLIFYTKTHDVFEFNKITAFRFFTILAAMAFFSRQIIRGSLDLRLSSLWPPLAAVGGTALIATLFSNNQLTSLLGVYEDFEGIITVANYLLLWLVLHQTTQTISDVKKYLLMIAVAGTLATGYGLAQNFGVDFIRWNPNTYTAARMFGSLGNPNFLAAYALMSLPLAWIFFMTSRKLSGKLIYLCMTIIMLLAIFFTKSRGAFYGLVAEVMVFTVYLIYDQIKGGDLWQRNKKWLMVVVLLAALTLLAPQVRQTVRTTITRTVATLDLAHIQMTPRLYIWKSALIMMKDKPWFGSGLDTFQITFPKYRLPLYWQLEWNGTPEKAHNFFLQIGATTGFLGLGAWLWLLVTYGAIIIVLFRKLQGDRRHLLAAMVLAQVGFLVQNQFNFTVIAYGSVFWFLLALAPVVHRQEADRDTMIQDRLMQWKQLSVRQTVMVSLVGLIGLASLFWSVRVWAADIYFKRGIIFMSRGYAPQAVTELERAVRINPLREIYWVKTGIAYETMAKGHADQLTYLKKAEHIHQHTISMNQLNGYNFNNLGRVYKYWGDNLDPKQLEAAETAAKQAVVRDPYNAYFNLDLASIYISLKKWDQVEQTATHLINLFPDFAMPYAYLGYVALMRGEKKKAEQQLSLAAEKNWRGDLHTRSSTLSNLGFVRAELGKLNGALKVFDEALKLKPKYVQARYNKALVLERLGENQLAINEYRTILSQAPNYIRANEIRQKIAYLEGRD